MLMRKKSCGSGGMFLRPVRKEASNLKYVSQASKEKEERNLRYVSQASKEHTI